MKKIKLLLSTVAFIAFSAASYAQIRGGVVDANGFPEVDAQVTVKGTSTVVYTDQNGQFDIDAKIGDVLLINGKEFQVMSNDMGVLKVQQEVIDLEEALIVVAFGKQRKEAIVGSVSVVDSKIIEKQQATNVLSAIQGSVPGVNIISDGGQPGQTPTIRIRGISSFSASSEPLIVLDGVPFNGTISMISQDMIESFTILKDAGATALYGARGANGVILIESKKGRKSVLPRITFTSQFGVASNAVSLHKRVGAADYMKYSWEALRNSAINRGLNPDEAGVIASNNLIDFLEYNPYGAITKPIDASGNLVPNANLLWDTDWEELLLNKTATRREYNLNVEGGNENTLYNFGVSYLNQEGAIITSYLERTTLNANISTKANNWLELGVNALIGFSNESAPNQSGGSYDSPIQWINTMSNIYPLHRRDNVGNLIYNDLGELIYDYGTAGGQTVNGTRSLLGIENAYGALVDAYKVKNKRSNVNANGYAKIQFNDDFSLRTNLGYQLAFLDYTSILSSQYGAAAEVGGRVRKDRNTVTTRNITSVLNFNRSFGNHTINIDGIMDLYDFNNETVSAQSIGFLPGMNVLNGATNPENISGRINQERILGYMSRAVYDYKNKYFVEGSFRKEASTRFHRDNRWGDFYSVGASWIISKERFLKEVDFLSNLKIRASYGEVGNNRVLNRLGQEDYFPYLQGYITGWSQLDEAGILIGGLADRNILWEKTGSTNIGIDFGFFKNRINGSVDYFTRESIDLIMGRAVAYSGSGQRTIISNIGSFRNYGVEVNLNTINIRNTNFDWSTNINIGTVKNKIIKLNESDQIIDGISLLKIGGSRYDFYLQEFAGVNPDNGEVLWYKDDKDGNRVTTNIYSEATRYVHNKSSLPKFEGGFSNYIRYKNLDLNVLFNFSVGAYVYDSSYSALMNTMSSAGRQVSVDMKNRWQKPGDITNVPKLLASNNDYSQTSTRFLFKNDYLRLKALNIGYNFSENVVNQIGLKGIRVYFQGDNLFTFQSHKGIDPEQSVRGTTNNRSYQQKIYAAGFNVKL